MAKSDMEQDPEYSQIQKKAFYSTVQDGLTEMFIGINMIIAGFIFINLFFVILLVLWQISWKKLETKLKSKYVYDRIGYVELSPNHKQQIKKYTISFIIIQGISIISLFIIVYFIDWRIDTFLHYAPIIVCGSITGKTLYFCIFSGRWSYIMVALISIIVMIIFIFLPFSTGLQHIVYYAWAIAGMQLIFGAIKFNIFIRNNPIIQEM